MITNIPYTKPSITALEIKFANDAVSNGWGTKCYEYINRFENEFANYLGVKYSVATSSCTGALHLGLSALGIGPGDNVIMADTNWIASAAPIIHLGAKPIFVDILPNSWCLDPIAVEKSINPKTKAIIAVHLYGNVCAMNKLLEISEKYSIPIIEDSAEAIGSIFENKKAGSIGLFGTFSFHGTKTITTGEGGILVTNDLNLYEKVLTLSNHGRDRKQTKQFWSDCVGFKYKMSNIQAAIGCAQLSRIEELIKRKKEIFSYYFNFLSGNKSLSMNIEEPNTKNGYWMPTLVFDKSLKINIDFLKQEFFRNNIDARIFFWPLSMLPMFVNKPQNINSYSIYKRAINLPSFHDITYEEQKRVLNVIENIINI
mgnify:CR=1 FL=1